MQNRMPRFNRRRERPQVDTEAWQQLLALVRMGLVVLMLSGFAFLGGALFEDVDVNGIAESLHGANILLRFFPLWMFRLGVWIFHPLHVRYAIAPLAALVAVMVAGARFVQDIYNLPKFSHGLKYILSSMFGLEYPELTIDGGQMVRGKKEVNLIDAVGGPGYVLIQPGNAVLFRELRRPSNVSITRSYFVAPFETVGQIANLDDQHDSNNDVKTMTRDGILVILHDVQFRYRILPEESGGRVIRRSLDRPYPYSEDAMRNMAYNLSVTKDGLESWHAAVRKSVTGVISDYINSHYLDELTAPMNEDRSPRDVIRADFDLPDRKARLKNLGAELLWIDIGHIEIVQEAVDERRVGYWAAEWLGDANAKRAFSDARRQAYTELGRAEAQAEVIISIAHALENVQMNNDPRENLRTIFLQRVASTLDALRDQNLRNQEGEPHD